MSVLPILTWPDARLAQGCEPVTDLPAAAALADDLLETMYAAPGRGLAAPQVGEMQRLFVMDVAWKEGPPEPVICINPEITDRAELIATGPEACLSIPGISADVPRAVWVDLRWQSPDGNTQEKRLTGFGAICAQHELDHLDGVVIFDRLDKATRAAKLRAYEALT